MPNLSDKLLEADVDYEVKMVEELWKLQEVLDTLPYSIRTLIEWQGEINGSIYNNWFLDTLEIVVNHETSLNTQDELKGIKLLIAEILAV